MSRSSSPRPSFGSHDLAVWLAFVLISHIALVQGQISSMNQVCKGFGTKNWPAPDCNQYVECKNGKGALKTCAQGNFNPYLKGGQCDTKYTCYAPRGFWRQTMPTGGLVSVHCTLMPYTNLVVIWHRGVAFWNGMLPQPGMASSGNPKNEILSAVLDPVNNKYQGYPVGPPFCSGHVQLPDGSILSCGGEWQNMNKRTVDPEDGIYKCRIFKCSKNDVKSCGWKTIGNISGRRWYPGMLLFPAYSDTKGPFALVTGGTSTAQDPEGPKDVPVFLDWVFPFAKDGKLFANSPATEFTNTLKDMNLYPVLFLMPFRNNGKYVMFQWGVNFGQLVTVDDPTKTSTPISVLKSLPAIKPDIAVTYPTGGCGALHPLEYPWTTNAKVTFFGGHWGKYNSFSEMAKINAGFVASQSSWTMDLTAGSPAWQEEKMPDTATMRTCLPLPNGKILLIHGVKKGRMTSTTAGQGCTKDQVFDNWIFDPQAPAGKKFSIDSADNPTYRAYHSCSVVMPDGSLFAAGGDTNPVPANTNACVGPLKLHYNVDGYVTPTNYKNIITGSGPKIGKAPKQLKYGGTYDITYGGNVDACCLVTPGSNTHVVEQSSRVVFFQVVKNDTTKKVITVKVPGDPVIIMPGPQMLFCSYRRDAYSKGIWVTLS